MNRRMIAVLAAAGIALPLALASTADASTCIANEKGAIVVNNVSCGTASTVLRRASDRMVNTNSMHPNVTVKGRYWMCRVTFQGSSRGTIACAYDGRHGVAASVRF